MNIKKDQGKVSKFRKVVNSAAQNRLESVPKAHSLSKEQKGGDLEKV